MLVLWSLPGGVVYFVLLSRVRKDLGLKRGQLRPGPRGQSDVLLSIVGAFGVMMLWPVVLIRWRRTVAYFVGRPERLPSTTYDN
jgi:hypothetical protein